MEAISVENLESEIRRTSAELSTVRSRAAIRQVVMSLLGSEFDEEFGSEAAFLAGVAKVEKAFAEDVSEYSDRDSLAVLLSDEILHRAVGSLLKHIEENDLLDRIIVDSIQATLQEQLTQNPADIVAGITSDIERVKR